MTASVASLTFADQALNTTSAFQQVVLTNHQVAQSALNTAVTRRSRHRRANSREQPTHGVQHQADTADTNSDKSGGCLVIADEVDVSTKRSVAEGRMEDDVGREQEE